MTTSKAATRGTIDAEITVANLQHVRSCTATRTVSATVPAPAVFRDKTATTSAESLIFAIALSECRGVMDVGCANLRVGGSGQCQGRQDAM